MASMICCTTVDFSSNLLAIDRREDLSSEVHYSYSYIMYCSFGKNSLPLFIDDEFTLLVICGDVNHYFGPMKLLSNWCFSSWSLMHIWMQAISLSVHRNGIELKFLRVFQMITGKSQTRSDGH